MAQLKLLKDYTTNEKIYPITHVNAVFNDDGDTVLEIIDNKSPLVVHLSYINDDLIADKTFNEISTALSNDRDVIVWLAEEYFIPQYFDLDEIYFSCPLLDTYEARILRCTNQDNGVWENTTYTYQPQLNSGENIKTVNGQSVMGSGNISIAEEQLPDKSYAPLDYSGLGRKYLQKNMVGGVNILIQTMVNDANTIYVVQYDYDLDEETITIPAGSVLKFEGGSIDNGTVVFQDTSIESSKECFGEDLTISGKVLQEANPDWFVGSDADKIEKAIDYFYDVECAARDYHITRAITITHSFTLRGSSFPEMYLSSHSRTRLIAEFTSATESENTILSIVGIPNGSVAQKYLSATIENLSFTSISSNYRNTNGVSISTAGGPSRPITIRNCNFEYLKKAFYAYGSTSSASTNAGQIEITTCNMSRNSYAIYGEGSHAFADISIDTCVIESNSNTAIYFPVDANGYFPSFGYVKLRNLLLEGQPKPIDIAIEGTLFVEGCYFESSSTSTINITGYLLSSVYMVGNTISTQGTYYINMSVITLQQYDNFFRSTNYLSLKRCVVNCEIDYVTTCNNTFFKVFKEKYKTKNTPAKTYKITPNIIDNGLYLRKATSSQSITASNTFSAGTYRFAALVLTTNNNNSVGLYKGSGQYWFLITFMTQFPSNTQYLLVHDYEFTESSSSPEVYLSVNGGYIQVSSMCISAYSSAIPRYAFNDFVNAFNPSNITSQVVADMFIAGSSKRPTFYNGSAWIDANGYTPELIKGTTAQRPTASLTSSDEGFEYFDTDLKRALNLARRVGSYTELTHKSNTSSYQSNPIAQGTIVTFRAHQMSNAGVLSVVRIIFTKTNQSTEDGIELELESKTGDGSSGRRYYKDIVAPDPAVYPYIWVSTSYTGYTYFYYAPVTLRWEEFDGAVAGVLRSGTTANRPASTDIYVGFPFWDTDLGKMIAWSGTAWKDIDDGTLNTSSTAQTKAGNLTAAKFITSGGTANQFVKGDGSLATYISTKVLQEPNYTASGTTTVTSFPLVNTLNGNVFCLLRPSQIIVEKTTDGGTTWEDAGLTDTQKINIFLGDSTLGSASIPKVDGVRSKQCGVRITITAMNYNVPAGTPETLKYNYWNSTYVDSTNRYCTVDEVYIWCLAVSDNIRTRVYCAKGNASTTWVAADKGTNSYLAGWSGGNFIALTGKYFGGGTSQAANFWNYRFEFFTDGVEGGDLATTSTSTTQCIYRIQGFGANHYTNANNFMKHNHLYSWNIEQNATFPAKVTATELVKSGGTSSQFLKADGSVDSNNYLPKKVIANTIPNDGMLPNVWYDLGVTDTVNITLATGEQGVVNEYHFVFTCLSSSCTVTLPVGVLLPTDLSDNVAVMHMEADRKFECHIVDNCLTFNCWDLVS